MKTLLQLLGGEKSKEQPIIRYLAVGSLYLLGLSVVLLQLRSLF